jgi:hypothetical protein
MKEFEQLNSKKISQKVALSTNPVVLRAKEKGQDAITKLINRTKLVPRP